MASGDINSVILSASTDGRPIKVVATGTPGTTVHTAVNATGQRDHVTLWACNTDSVSRTLTIQWGGTTAPDDHTGPITLPPNAGDALVLLNRPIAGGLLVRAFASAADVVTITGTVFRYVD